MVRPEAPTEPAPAQTLAPVLVVMVMMMVLVVVVVVVALKALTRVYPSAGLQLAVAMHRKPRRIVRSAPTPPKCEAGPARP